MSTEDQIEQFITEQARLVQARTQRERGPQRDLRRIERRALLDHLIPVIGVLAILTTLAWALSFIPDPHGDWVQDCHSAGGYVVAPSPFEESDETCRAADGTVTSVWEAVE